jgi:UDP-glucose 4-epimerase
VTGRILVTGATGFIGRHLVPALSSRGFHVRAAVRQHGRSFAFGPEVEIAPLGDLRSEVNWRPLVAGMHAVVHLAGIAHTGPAVARDVYERVNRLAVRDLSQAARAVGSRLIFLSSVRAQAGATAPAILTEDTKPEPSDDYGRAKLEAERDIAAIGGRFVILRPVLVYGPGVAGNMGALLRLARLPFPLPFGSVHNARSLLAIENLIEAIALCATSESALAGTFLVADDASLSLPAMISSLRWGAGRRPGIFPVPTPLLAIATRALGKADAWRRMAGNLVVSTERIKSIGYAPVVTTHDALAAMARLSA